MKIAVVGATGLVGREILKVLEEKSLFNDINILAVASERSAGTLLKQGSKELIVLSKEECLAKKPDIAIFSAGGAISKEWAPRFAEAGCTVIDNSSAWRMEEGIPLIVPEINAGILTQNDKIIANPNCSTIQMVLALAPLHKAYKIERVVVSTYQSVSGSGVSGLRQLENEEKGIIRNEAYPHQIHRNLLPHGGDFLRNGYTTEEMKLVHETRKILNAPQMAITATVVRVPVTGGHSESVNVAFKKAYQIEDVRKLLEEFPGLVLLDEPLQNIYPMPLNIRGRDEVFIGRLRVDESCKNALNLWVVADNLRKGAATNAVQIAEHLINHKLV